MTYPETARAFAAAEYRTAISGAHDLLPMSDWAEARRDQMTPQTIAVNHATHVQSLADDLRAMLAAPAPAPTQTTITGADLERYRWIEHNARALLAAIGESE